MDTLIAWIMRAIPFGTIIMYGAMGEIVTEKCGNLNLGVPGIMYLGGFAGFASAYLYENTAANPNMALCVVISLLCAFAASIKRSGATSTPRSTTSSPLPSNMIFTRFLPMSCMSPRTVPRQTRPIVSVPPAVR